MSWAEDNANDLWKTKNKVDQLGDEEEHHCLTEVSKDTNYSKCHAGTVAESVSHKYLRRKAVVFQQCQGA